MKMENLSLTPLILHGPEETVLINYLHQNYPSQQFIYFHIKPEKTSIKIDQIHQLKTKLALTSTKLRLIWLQQAHLATLAAQNALLKILEEPPKNTFFILTTTNLNKLLPTILSRCQLKYFQSSNQTPNQDLLNQIKTILKQDFGERLTQLKNLPKDRNQAINWFTELIRSLDLARQQTQDLNKLRIFSKILKPALQAKQHLQANLNLDLTLEHFLLSLPKTTN